MRKTLLALTLSAAALVACTDPNRTDMSPEEEYWMNAYAVVQSAYAYDEVCNKGQFTTSKNPALSANNSMIATQVYEALRNNHPNAPESVFRRAVENAGKSMHDNEVKMLKTRGCDAKELKPFGDALTRYTSTSADENYTVMQQDMNRKGITRAKPVVKPAS